MNEAATRPDRLARFREAAANMDEALREEGFDAHGSHAIFVRWQRESVEGLGGILLEAETKMGERVEDGLRAGSKRPRGGFATTSSGAQNFCWPAGRRR